MDYETVIGLEVHVQLSTNSKLFCGCPTVFGSPPNSQVCPVCLGLPGVLPVLNQRALEWGIRVGVSLNCRIAKIMKFDRKQYYYPDLPKNYQISQYDRPLAEDGYLDVTVHGRAKRVRIERVHLEEDAGKLLHDPQAPFSYVDLNRAGMPLLEIVSEPDMDSSEAASQYLLELKAILKYLDVSTCNMEEGSLRCDTNISLRAAGAPELGTKVEIKNLNSFKAVRGALEYEITRQAKDLDEGRTIRQETRLWDAKALVTEPMRSKEGASDYRYFPEPDLVPFVIDQGVLGQVRESLPELPAQRRQRFVKEYGLSAYDAQVLTQAKAVANLFEETISCSQPAKSVANWIMGDVLAYLNAHGQDPESLSFRAEWLAHLLEAIDNKTISGKMAKDVLVESLERQEDPASIIQTRGLRQIVDDGVLERLAEEVLAAHAASVQDYRKGKRNALMFLVGQCMRRSKGTANPQQVTDILQRKLEG